MSPFSTHLTHITVLLCVVLPAWQYEHAIVMCIQLMHSIDTLVSFVTEAIEQVLLAVWLHPVRTASNAFVVCSALAVFCELLKQFQKHVYVVPRRPRRRHRTRTQEDEVEVDRAEEQEGDRGGRRQMDEGTDRRERKEGNDRDSLNVEPVEAQELSSPVIAPIQAPIRRSRNRKAPSAIVNKSSRSSLRADAVKARDSSTGASGTASASASTPVDANNERSTAARLDRPDVTAPASRSRPTEPTIVDHAAAPPSEDRHPRHFVHAPPSRSEILNSGRTARVSYDRAPPSRRWPAAGIPAGQSQSQQVGSYGQAYRARDEGLHGAIGPQAGSTSSAGRDGSRHPRELGLSSDERLTRGLHLPMWVARRWEAPLTHNPHHLWLRTLVKKLEARDLEITAAADAAPPPLPPTADAGEGNQAPAPPPAATSAIVPVPSPAPAPAPETASASARPARLAAPYEVVNGQDLRSSRVRVDDGALEAERLRRTALRFRPYPAQSNDGLSNADRRAQRRAAAKKHAAKMRQLDILKGALNADDRIRVAEIVARRAGEEAAAAAEAAEAEEAEEAEGAEEAQADQTAGDHVEEEGDPLDHLATVVAQAQPQSAAVFPFPAATVVDSANAPSSFAPRASFSAAFSTFSARPSTSTAPGAPSSFPRHSASSAQGLRQFASHAVSDARSEMRAYHPYKNKYAPAHPSPLATMSPVIASPPSTTSAQNSPLESFLRSAFSRTGRFAALQPGPAAAMSYTPTAAPAFASVSGPAWAPPMSAGGSALLARMGPRLIEPAAPAPYTAPTPPPPATSAVSTEAGDSWIPIGSTSKAQPARSLAQRIAPAPAPALTPGPSANYTFQQQGFPPYYATSGAGSSRPQGKRRTPEPEGDDEEDVEPQYWNRQFKRSRGSGKGKG